MIDYEYLLHEINDFGAYQKLRYLLICLAALLPAIVTYAHSFIAPNPSHRCAHPYYSNDSYEVKSSFYDESANTNVTDLTRCTMKVNGTEQKCSAWVFDKQFYQSSLTEDWSMVCSRSTYRNSVQTVYFAGYLIGSLLMGILADHFGRRPIMLSSFIMIVAGSVGVAFGVQDSFGVTTSYLVYAACRFLIACGTRGINVTGFVLGMEMVGPSKRTFAGIVFEYFFGIGQLVLVAIAYVNNVLLGNGWRSLAIILILPSVPFLGYFFILPESPRWLLAKRRKEEALEIIKHVAKVNKRELNMDTWNTVVDGHLYENTNKKQESIITLIRSSKLAAMSIILFLNWMINNLIFYGLGLKSNDLGINPYLSFAILAVVEIIGYTVVHLILDKLGRKLPYVVFLFFAGLSCTAISFFESTYLVFGLAMVGKFSASASYAIIYLYSSELFPTSVRNSGMGACSMMARVGAMVAPLINDLGDIYSPHVPFLIFGVAGLLGSATALILPETLHRPLPENVKQAEQFNKFGLTCKANMETSKVNNDPQKDENELQSLNSFNA